MKASTKRRFEILNAMKVGREYTAVEVAKKIGVSRNCVNHHADWLADHGFMEKSVCKGTVIISRIE